MNTITAYECSFCGFLSKNKLEIESHEMGCMLTHLYKENKDKEQKIAKSYLDSFRKKSRTLTELFTFIEQEQDQIIEAIKVLKFYRKNIRIAKIKEFTFSNHGFSSPDKPDSKRMTHSAPVGMPKLPMYPYPEDVEDPLAFDIEIFYELEDAYKRGSGLKHENILDFIGGINTSGGGSCGDGYHAYSTFWIQDFPLGIREL